MTFGVTDRPLLDDLVRELLTTIEFEEVRLLSWGVVDGAFSREDVEAFAVQVIDRAEAHDHYEPANLVDALEERGLVIELPWHGDRVLRSRMAEGVRLFARLKQLFNEKQWRSGPNLVSDFRFILRARRYPKRDIPIATALSELKAEGVLGNGRAVALQALLERPHLTGLAAFQVRATKALLRNADAHTSRGIIVTVGTGSGKTLAFYLPAFAFLAPAIRKEPPNTKAIALYPRNELLKDQFSETYLEARRLDTVLSKRRKLIIGAYFGPTPYSASEEDVAEKWSATPAHDGYVCPFLRCPTNDCNGELVWRTADISAGRGRLACPVCQAVVGDDEVALTRRQMQDSPPDILFTTTEMLNRSMSDSYSCHVFGLGVASPPSVVLLDEVHTYTGTHGAQAALLLRRWRHAVRRPVQFVGLSATLRNASEFFGSLIGLEAEEVEEITPRTEEMVEEGVEYLLALRGDPVSKTSLPSTTIQSVMLLRRLLDPRNTGGEKGVSQGLFGQKVFLFTDDLDVTNRLYYDTLDAERRNGDGTPQAGRKPLAALRSQTCPDHPQRLLAGQSWYVAEEIGHPLGLAAPLEIGRTSSQDVGVDRKSDVVVATASLEVGYNDPTVGAVIQHKAPRDPASFLQRKGRAGRNRAMRPWTVVVLSDYGRDRIAFQGYDSLFDPVIAAKSLPVANRHVLRMQAVFAFMDWIGGQIRSVPPGSVYRDFSGPGNSTRTRKRQEAEAVVIQRLLGGEKELLGSLESHFREALDLAQDEVLALLWEPPRALILHVLPTIHRRLVSGWKRMLVYKDEIPTDFLVANAPLPDFIPANLFSDLNLPEVAVVSSSGFKSRTDSIPVLQALTALTPGKVTRRFAVRSGQISHWIPLPDFSTTAIRQRIAVEDICSEFEELGAFSALGEDGIEAANIRCVRPWEMRPEITPKAIAPSSNSRLKWRTQLLPVGDGLALDLPTGSPWAQIVSSIHVFSHAYQAHLEVRRFAIGATAELRFNPRRLPIAQAPTSLTSEVEFVGRDGAPAALGFRALVDGLRFYVPLVEHGVIALDHANGENVRAFRTAYFRERVRTDATLLQHANAFKLDWLFQVYMSALSAWAIREETTFAQAREALGQKLQPAARRVLDVVFESLNLPETEDAQGSGGEDAYDAGSVLPEEAPDLTRKTLRDEVLELFANKTVTGRLQELASVLWEAPDAGWLDWERRRYLTTLGGALLEACQQLYPEADADDLVLDIEPGLRSKDIAPLPPGVAELWITEAVIGGGGVIEEISRRLADDPRRFFRLVEAALGPTDFEITDAELRRIVDLMVEDDKVVGATQAVRQHQRHEELQASVIRLEDVLSERGVLVSHPVMVAMHARVLRPGTGPATDRLLQWLIREWRDKEVHLGAEVDPRVFAFLASDETNVQVTEALASIDPAAATDRAFRFHAIYSLLWPRGSAVRALGLSAYNPFATLPPPDRQLVLDHLPRRVLPINVLEADWRIRAETALKQEGIARLVVPITQSRKMKDVLIALTAQPVEVDYLYLYPRVESVERRVDEIVASIELPDVPQ